LDIVGIRLPLFPLYASDYKLKIFRYQGRNYQCSFSKTEKELKIINDQGKMLAVKRGQQQGFLGTTRENSQKVDITQPRYFNLIKAAMEILGL
ncbi:MAG: single-stranded-DNA-specific exonuclease RecJ, partial [cyanobacterium endosymbiont of Rhopalodia yunnanensis]